MKLRLSDDAAADITETRDWYAERSMSAADQFLDALTLAFETIEMFPSAAPLVDVHVRRFKLHRFPHSLYYILESDEIIVFACLHGRRSDLAWRTREG